MSECVVDLPVSSIEKRLYSSVWRGTSQEVDRETLALSIGPFPLSWLLVGPKEDDASNDVCQRKATSTRTSIMIFELKKTNLC